MFNCEMFNRWRICRHVIWIEVLHFGKFPSGDISDAEDSWEFIRQRILDIIKKTHIDVSSTGNSSFSYPARQKIPAKPIPLINPFDSRSSKPYGTGMTATLSSPYLRLLQSSDLIPTLNVAVANPGQIAQPNPGQIVRRAQ
eukprot:scaffold12212_cov86-Skeletonema_marinoi.AAC.4